MSRLKAEPATPIRTVLELRAVARLLAAEAAGLHRALARRMGDMDEEGTRRIFEDLAQAQRRHAEPPAGDAGEAARLRPEAWHGIIDDEDLGRTRLATPYLALSVAVRNAERVFAFWSYVSAHAETAELRSEAERLALDALEHVRALRDFRRRAFHAGGGSEARGAQRLRAASPGAFAAEAARIERALADLHEAIAAALAEAGHPDAPLVAEVASRERLGAEGLGGGAGPADAGPGDLPRDPEALIELALERLEVAVELYLAAADASKDEEVVAAAQRLSHSALGRLALLRERRRQASS